MAVTTRSFTCRGPISYNPTSVAEDSDRPTQLFRPRRRGQGRVRISPVTEAEVKSAQAKAGGKSAQATTHALERSFERLSFKLAASRDNARRFLKSVITNPTSSTDPETERPKKTKRRSWSPVKRRASGDTTASTAGGGRSRQHEIRH